jgi:hypothetical protein
VSIHCADTLYPQKLALTSPTSGGRSVGKVHLLTKGYVLFLFVCPFYLILGLPRSRLHFCLYVVAERLIAKQALYKKLLFPGNGCKAVNGATSVARQKILNKLR